jgi:cytoskeletal protein RodZ
LLFVVAHKHSSPKIHVLKTWQERKESLCLNTWRGRKNRLGIWFFLSIFFSFTVLFAVFIYVYFLFVFLFFLKKKKKKNTRKENKIKTAFAKPKKKKRKNKTNNMQNLYIATNTQPSALQFS